MTLSIAGKYPWGIMRNLPGGPGQSAILFATDSRLTHLSSGIARDVGPKLFQLSTNAGVVYAGWVESAVECIRCLQNHLRNHTYEKVSDALIQAERIVSDKHSSLLERYSMRNASLQFLIGMYDLKLNSPRLFRLVDNTTPPFQADKIEGLNAIGSAEETRDLFKQKFEEEVDRQLSRGISDNPTQWILYIIMALSSVIEAGTVPSVGGLIQTAIVDRNGFSWVSHGAITPDDKDIATQRVEDRWRQIEDSGRVIQETDPSLDPSMRALSKISE